MRPFLVVLAAFLSMLILSAGAHATTTTTFVSPTLSNNTVSEYNDWAAVNITAYTDPNGVIGTGDVLLEWTYPNNSIINYTMTLTELCGVGGCGGIPASNVSAIRNMSGLPSGLSRYRVWVNDTLGGSSLSVSVQRYYTFSYFGTNITFVSPTPANNTVIATGSTSINATTNNTMYPPWDSGFWSFLEWTHANGSRQNTSMDCNGMGAAGAPYEYACSTNVTGLSYGLHSYRVFTNRTDPGPAHFNTSVTRYLYVDTGLIVNITNPLNGVLLNSSAINVTVNASTRGLTPVSATLYVDGVAVSTNNTPLSDGVLFNLSYNFFRVRNYSVYARVCTANTCNNSAALTYVVVAKAAPVVCGASVPTGYSRFLTINLTDEKNYFYTPSLTGTIAVALVFNDGSASSNFSFLNTSVNQTRYCVSDNRLGETFDLDVSASAGSTYPLGAWYARRENVTNSPEKSITVALINTTHGTQSDVYIVDKYGTQTPDWYAAILNYDYTNGMWRVLRYDLADYQGKTTFYLERNTQFYSFIVYDSSLSYRFTVNYQTVGSEPITLSEPISSSSALSKSRNIVASCTNTTTTLTCTVMDNNSPRAFKTAHLRTWRGNALNWSIDCERSGTENPAVLVCDIETGRLYWVNVYVDINPQGIGLLNEFIGGTGGHNRDWGRAGIIATAFLTASMAGVMYWNFEGKAVGMVIGSVIGFSFSWAAGLIALGSQPNVILSAMVLLAALVMWRVRGLRSS